MEQRFSDFFPAVSRETLDALGAYHDLLLKWQRKINLVSPSTLTEIWNRHFLDSAQIFLLLSNHNARILDLGSGAGFPGLILSLLGATSVMLIESDKNKCAFLAEVIRHTKNSAKIVNGRVENFASEQKAEVITARGFAPLERIFALSEGLLAPGGEYLLLKGQQWQAEIEEARRDWQFDCDAIPSITSAESRILHITKLRKIQ